MALGNCGHVRRGRKGGAAVANLSPPAPSPRDRPESVPGRDRSGRPHPSVALPLRADGGHLIPGALELLFLGELRRTPVCRSSRQRESLHSYTQIVLGAPDEGYSVITTARPP